MKTTHTPSIYSLIWFLSLLLHFSIPGTARGSNGIQGAITLPSSSVFFITNTGQLDRNVVFYTRTSEGAVYVTRDAEIVYSLKRAGGHCVLRERFVTGREIEVTGGTPSDTRVNHYRGTDRSRWREDLATFRSVNLEECFESIDVHLVTGKVNIEKLFVVHPGGNAADIRVKVENARYLDVSETGDLSVVCSHGKVLFSRPQAYQIKDGKRIKVEVSYRVDDRGYGFAVGDHDRSLSLIIDPLLASTYVGGTRNETTYALGVSGGDVIVAGTADSTDFPGLDEEINVLGDAFVIRLDPELTSVLAATYFGGSMTDGIRDMLVDGNVIYAAGYNNSPNFPTTPNAAYAGTSLSGSFVVRLDTATLRMTAATSYHGNVFALARAPGTGDVYIAGATGNTAFPLAGGNFPAFQSTHRGGADSFLAVFNEDLTHLKGATLLGGEGFDIAYDLTVDERGYPVVAGVTNSAAFPASANAFDSTYNLQWGSAYQWVDGFIAVMTPDLSGLVASTYLGGESNDNLTAVYAEGSSILVGGSTNSSDFPCASSFGPVDGNDAFLVIFKNDLSETRSCALFGGSRPGTGSPESVSDLAIHPSGLVFATGRTNARDFPTTQGAFLSQPSGSYFGAFIIAFDNDLRHVEGSTLIHGGSEDMKALAFDAWGDVIVAGDSSGGGYPVTPHALQPEHKGGDDLVVSRFTPDLTGPHIEVVPEKMDFGFLPVGMKAQEEIVLHNIGGSELAIKDIRFAPAPAADFSVEKQCSYIPPFSYCPIEVVFIPIQTGARSAQLLIYSDDPFRPEVAVQLKGGAIKATVASENEKVMITGGEPLSPRLEVLPDPCEFGQVQTGSSLSRTVRVVNTGASDLYLTKVVLEDGTHKPFSITGDSCSGMLLQAGRGGSGPSPFCEIQIVFTPETASRAEGRLALVSNDPSSPVYTVSLLGTGVETAEPGYPGFWGWFAIVVLVLRMILRIPVTARGWGRWIRKKESRI